MEIMFNNYLGSNSDLPPLRGIIHAAGLLDDGILVQQNWERFEKVFKPKISGAWNLHLLTKNMSIDFMIYFSSVASMFGSPGQSNYAAANSFLDLIAAYRRNNGLPAQSINWGPWSTVGMAADNDKKINTGAGINKISPAQGIYLLQQIFDENHIQAGAISIDWELFNEQFDDSYNLSLFEYFVNSNNDKKKQEHKIPELIKKLEETEEEERLDLIRNFLTEKIKNVLGMDGTQKISSSKPLSEMGIDSLMGLEIKKIIDIAIGKNLPATMVFNYPTINALSKHILLDVLNYSESSKNENLINEDNSEDEVEDVISDVEDLSDEEAEKLLLKKLSSDNSEDI